MKTYFSLIMLLFIVAIVTACGAAPTPAAQQASEPEATMTASDLSARATTENGAVYMTLTNKGSSDDALISAKTDVAKTVELHETTMGEGDMMQMKPVVSIPVPAGGSVKLEPGGLHVMLIGLQKKLATGDKISLTLNFEKAPPLTVEAEVKEGVMPGHHESAMAGAKAKIAVSAFFARATTENGAVYMTLKNEGSDDDALVAAETDVARAVELHQTTIGEGDVMKMQPVPTIPIPAGGSVKLEPGGLHVMLIGLQKELAMGDKINLTLKFEKAEPVTIEAEVRESGTMGHMEHGGTEEPNNANQDSGHN
jgi:hypothetical protein